ncbi:WD repeat-containing protein CG11141 [Plutella xylostella]|uniref:WD repeat-containing protein CG11141 n=1 Tax=Plutella xylostella TaxID=51655 RepID=UPI002032F36E|nr:WD repeat-containing protein CG11141 [Plutella xylostella]
MEVTGGEEEGFVREWAPCTHMLSLIPPRVQNGLFSNELCITCIDAVPEYIALGTNVGLVYWYDRKKGNIQRLRCEVSSSPITYVKIVSTVDYMVGAGNAAGQVTVFQIPKEHPHNLPDTLKPKVEPKVERYTIGDLHKSRVTAIEWSKNGMRLFSGDKNGVIIMTEIDFYMHLCKSMEIVNEEHEIVQLSYNQNTLLVSSLYRSIVCERRDNRWHHCQVGKRDRKSLSRLGGVFVHSYAAGAAAAAAAAYCARGAARLWRCDRRGDVLQTLIFKEAISNPLTVVELLNPSQKKPYDPDREHNFGPLHVFREHFLVTYNEDVLYILDPRSLTAIATVDQLRKIKSVAVSGDEIWVVEGARSVLRLARAPDAAAADEAVTLMTKSLSSLQQAVNTVREFSIDATVPFISSVLEQPISLLTNNEFLDAATIANAEECFELPPIKNLPADIAGDVLESIVNEFKDVSDTEELRKARSEELEKKLKMYNSIMEQKCDEAVIHSRRSRRGAGAGAGGAGGRSPRHVTPARSERAPPDGVSYTSPCVMNLSVYGNIPQEPDDVLEKQIEEKEKILAKMLNIESLSIKPSSTTPTNGDNEENTSLTSKEQEHPVTSSDVEIQPERKTDIVDKPVNTEKTTSTVKKLVTTNKQPNPMDLVPKLVKLPNNWNLGDFELKLEVPDKAVSNGRQLMSPDEHIESEWEFV